MAKDKRGIDDLDAELAALEAELAAMESGKKKAKAAKKEPAPDTGEKKPRFALPKLPKKGKVPEPFAPAPSEPRPEPNPEPAARTPLTEAATPSTPAELAQKPAAALHPTYDPRLWRQEGGAWVRTVPTEALVVRRILDEKGELVREEAATREDVDEVTGVKAEKGLGSLLRRNRK